MSIRLLIGNEPWAAGWADMLGTTRLWEVADWATVWLELAFIVAFFNRRWWRCLTAAAVVFHFGVWALYDIVFETNVITYGAFLPYARAVARWPALDDLIAGNRPAVRMAPLVFCASLAAATFAVLTGTAFGRIVHLPVMEFILMTGFAIVCAWLAWLVKSWARPRLARTEVTVGNEEVGGPTV
jgi:hypothetical protein